MAAYRFTHPIARRCDERVSDADLYQFRDDFNFGVTHFPDLRCCAIVGKELLEIEKRFPDIEKKVVSLFSSRRFCDEVSLHLGGAHESKCMRFRFYGDHPGSRRFIELIEAVDLAKGWMYGGAGWLNLLFAVATDWELTISPLIRAQLATMKKTEALPAVSYSILPLNPWRASVLLLDWLKVNPNDAIEDGKPKRSAGHPKRSKQRELKDKRIVREWAKYKSEGRSRADLARDMGITIGRIELAQDAERNAPKPTK